MAAKPPIDCRNDLGNLAAFLTIFRLKTAKSAIFVVAI
jgi:hypothetical protein